MFSKLDLICFEISGVIHGFRGVWFSCWWRTNWGLFLGMKWSIFRVSFMMNLCGMERIGYRVKSSARISDCIVLFLPLVLKSVYVVLFFDEFERIRCLSSENQVFGEFVFFSRWSQISRIELSNWLVVMLDHLKLVFPSKFRSGLRSIWENGWNVS